MSGMYYENDGIEKPAAVILAGREFTPAQKEAVIRAVTDEIICEPLLTPDSTEADIRACVSDWYLSGKQEEKIREGLKNGKYVYWGDFDDGSLSTYTSLARLAEMIWKAALGAEKGDIEAIDGDLRDPLSE